MALTRRMFTCQFETTAKILKKDEDPLHTYVVQTVLQLYIAELSEPIREVYTMAYSLPSTMEFIYRETAEKWRQISRGMCRNADLRISMKWKSHPRV